MNHANPYSSISLFKTLVKIVHRHLRIEGFIGYKDCTRRASDGMNGPQNEMVAWKACQTCPELAIGELALCHMFETRHWRVSLALKCRKCIFNFKTSILSDVVYHIHSGCVKTIDNGIHDNISMFLTTYDVVLFCYFNTKAVFLKLDRWSNQWHLRFKVEPINRYWTKY